jgi:hypothetical protein
MPYSARARCFVDDSSIEQTMKAYASISPTKLVTELSRKRHSGEIHFGWSAAETCKFIVKPCTLCPLLASNSFVVFAAAPTKLLDMLLMLAELNGGSQQIRDKAN